MIAADLALISAGLFLLVGMLTGVWKYSHIMKSADATAPMYVDIAHRAALMYSFALIVLMLLAQRSVWPNVVNLLAVLANLLFFASAVFGYVVHGFLQDTDNQLRQPHKLGKGEVPRGAIKGYMWGLIAAEIGGTVVLVSGAIVGV